MKRKNAKGQRTSFELLLLTFFILHPSSFIIIFSHRVVDNIADLAVAVYDHETDQGVENLNER